MDKKYKFSSVENSEIKFRWLRLGIRAKYAESIEPALKMSTDQGRMKFTRPLFRYVEGCENKEKKIGTTYSE